MLQAADYLFKKASEADISGIEELDRLCFAVPWTKAMFFNDICENTLTDYIAVYYDGCVVGYGGMWVILDEAHITNICTHPDFRRHGIAKEILLRLFRILAVKNVRTVTLEVRISNTAAMRLYEKFGFHIVGRRRGYYSDNGEDAFIMRVDNPSVEIAAGQIK